MDCKHASAKSEGTTLSCPDCGAECSLPVTVFSTIRYFVLDVNSSWEPLNKHPATINASNETEAVRLWLDKVKKESGSEYVGHIKVIPQEKFSVFQVKQTVSVERIHG